MALVRSTNDAFCAIFSTTRKVAQLRDSRYGIVVTKQKDGFRLELVGAGGSRFNGPHSTLTVRALENIESGVRILSEEVHQNPLDVPVFHEREASHGEFAREFVYVDASTLQPIEIQGERIARAYNPVI